MVAHVLGFVSLFEVPCVHTNKANEQPVEKPVPSLLPDTCNVCAGNSQSAMHYSPFAPLPLFFFKRVYGCLCGMHTYEYCESVCTCVFLCVYACSCVFVCTLFFLLVPSATIFGQDSQARSIRGLAKRCHGDMCQLT